MLNNIIYKHTHGIANIPMKAKSASIRVVVLLMLGWLLLLVSCHDISADLTIKNDTDQDLNVTVYISPYYDSPNKLGTIKPGGSTRQLFNLFWNSYDSRAHIIATSLDGKLTLYRDYSFGEVEKLHFKVTIKEESSWLREPPSNLLR